MRRVTAFTVVLALGGVSGAHAQAPYLVKDIWPGLFSSEPTPAVPFGDRVFFGAKSPELGFELWSTGGTEESTTVLELAPGADTPGPFPFVSLSNGVLFNDYRSGGLDDPELWRTDGTLAGTQWVADRVAFRLLARSADQALFMDAFSAAAPFLTDGTPVRTFQVPPPLGGAPPEVQIFTPGAAFAGGIAFAPLLQGAWWTDGTPTGTTRLVDSPYDCWGVAAAGGRLFLLCSRAGLGLRLLVSDGTYSGTESLAVGQFGQGLVAGDDLVFFKSFGWLGRSDGTVGGTGPIPAPSPAPSVFLEQEAKASGNVLYFAGTTPESGKELWRTDGTAAGTFMLRDIDPGPGSGIDPNTPFWLTVTPDGVVFAARTSATGTELWKSDGTTAGTVPLPEIVPGPDSASPTQLITAGGRVYFRAYDPAHGRELWALDVTKGAVAVDDTFVQEGDSGTTTATFTVRLESAATVPVVVSYQTVAVTAQAGSDYGAQSGTLTFAPGERERAVDVPVFGDVAHERNESLKLVLTPVGGAVIADRMGALVILDDDQPRVRAIGAAPVVEGNGWFTKVPFGVMIETDGGPTAVPVSVYLAPAGGTATPGIDFENWAPVLTFPAGTPSGTTLTATIRVLGDTLDEPDETYSYELDGQNEAVVTGGPASGLILDDDGVAAARPVELSHGTTAHADLLPPSGPGPDRDYYVLMQRPEASYELVVDEVSGDAAPLTVQRIAADGTTVLQSAEPVGTGTARSLRWQNSTFEPISDQHIRVESASCGTVCGADDTYRIRLYETTLRGARVNNTNGQVTVLLLQNLTDSPVIASVHLWTEDGANGAVGGHVIPARGTLVHDTSQNLFVPGSLWVTHDAPYGGVAGKVVALEPATGFHFDTPLTSKPR